MGKADSTIAAIATSTGGGIGIVRVSGPLAESIGRALCRPWPTDPRSHQLYPGKVVGPAGEVLDQVLFCLMRAPRSYTGEDVLEIQGHGGAHNLSRLLQAVLGAGAVMARPGEFTERAFLAGKLDLVQAEAVAATIGAQSAVALRHAQRQLQGELGSAVQDLRRRTVALLGAVEGALDFPDLEADQTVAETLRSEVAQLEMAVQALVRGFSGGGRALSQGLQVGLVGPTNAGKSSLINALCQQERVLVDAQPGTTRDYIEVHTTWEDVPVTLIDTAGARPDSSALEQQGLRLGRQRWSKADLVLLVVDGTVGWTASEQELLREIQATTSVVLAWNKVDHHGCRAAPEDVAVPVVRCSALCGWGLAELRSGVLQLLAPQRREEGLLVTSARQAALLAEAAHALRRVRAALDGNPSWDVLSADLRQAGKRLSEVTGEDVSPAVLEAIFSRFCVGK